MVLLERGKMKRKLLNETYMRGVEKYKIKLFDDKENDCFVVVKKIIKIDKPFIVNDNTLKLLDDEFCLIEVTPKNENYNLRIYLDEKYNILQYYFDVTLENGFDDVTGYPYYIDLYTDITITEGLVKILDLDELQQALACGDINQQQFELAEKVKNNLLEEIIENKNKYLNMDLKKYYSYL